MRSHIPVNAVSVQFIFIFANSTFVWTVYYTKILFSSVLLSSISNHVSLTSSVPNTGSFLCLYLTHSAVVAPLTSYLRIATLRNVLCRYHTHCLLPANCVKPQVESQCCSNNCESWRCMCVCMYVCMCVCAVCGVSVCVCGVSECVCVFFFY